MQDPDPTFQPQPGVAETLEPGLRRILVPNPSPMTFRGTNTYLLGETDLAVIDPGPMDLSHKSAILDALKPDQHISCIVVTHAHLDHSPLAHPLAEVTGAPVVAFGDALAGRSAAMTALVAQGYSGGGEGVDISFSPTVRVKHGEQITGSDWTLRVHHTPGHFGNHISLEWNGALFCGDLVMGWSSSLVSPPDGDLTDFMASCRRLQSRDWRVFYPGHGAAIPDPAARLDWLITHRLAREAQILAALAVSPADAPTVVKRVYTDLALHLHPAAARNVLAHLIDLQSKSRARALEPISGTCRFALQDDDHPQS